ncbi:hypothetical protein D3C80_1171360 [compost metagenome]
MITSSTLPILSLSVLSRFIASLELITSLARRSICATASPTTRSPSRACWSAIKAASEACSALRATSCTVAVIWFIAVATWSVSTFWLLTPALVCSVTADSSSAALAICVTPSPMPPISSRKPWVMRCMLACNWPSSSRRCTCRLWVRSPLATRSAARSVWRSGMMICRVMAQAASRPRASASTVATASSVLACAAAASRTSVCEVVIIWLACSSTVPCSTMRCSACSLASWALPNWVTASR